jgi:hypothetical protein
MMYDRDLKWIRRAAIVIGILNLTATVSNLLARNWATGIASLLWVSGVWLLMTTIRANQKTRDEVRIASAGMSVKLEEPG